MNTDDDDEKFFELSELSEWVSVDDFNEALKVNDVLSYGAILKKSSFTWDNKPKWINFERVANSQLN